MEINIINFEKKLEKNFFDLNIEWLNHFFKVEEFDYEVLSKSKYYIIDADRKTKSELFDNEEMAAWLTEITKDPYDGKHLPKFSFKFVKDETAIQFYICLL